MIIVFAGHKGSGKNTAANYVVGETLRIAKVLYNGFKITDHGQLYVYDIFGNKEAEGIFDITLPTRNNVGFFEEEIYPFVKVYSFADLLKREVCIKTLGLSYRQCYGTNNDKNSYTNLLWQNMPDVIFDWEGDKPPENWTRIPFKGRKFIFHKPGLMTAREVLQYVGTNIFRKMYSQVWVDALLRQIEQDDPETAVITDARFPDEVEAVQELGGKAIYLTRNPYPADAHDSETALDYYEKFDAIIENSELDIPGQNAAVDQLLTKWGVFKNVPEK